MQCPSLTFARISSVSAMLLCACALACSGFTFALAVLQPLSNGQPAPAGTKGLTAREGTLASTQRARHTSDTRANSKHGEGKRHETTSCAPRTPTPRPQSKGTDDEDRERNRAHSLTGDATERRQISLQLLRRVLHATSTDR